MRTDCAARVRPCRRVCRCRAMKSRCARSSTTPTSKCGKAGQTSPPACCAPLAGGESTPLVVPPTVAILGAGKLQRVLFADETVPEIHTRLPLSLTFDHRCITGGEACRFLGAVIADLARPE